MLPAFQHIDDIIPPIRRSRNHHSLTFETLATFARAHSFLKQPDWNALPDSIITSAEGAEDRVAKFTSLMRNRDYLPITQVPVNECH